MSDFTFAYRAITVFGRTFQFVLLAKPFVTLNGAPKPPTSVDLGFRLVPVRSPLLGESLLLSFPDGTEMFQFPSFAPLTR